MKLAEYIICKNEIQHLDKGLKELIKLDVICILDTGSTDGTYEKLLELEKQYNNIHVRQKTYNPFYFDDARNDALDFVRKYVQDGDWLFTLDLDEYVSSNFVDIVRPQLEAATNAEAICLLDHTGCWHGQGHRYRKDDKWFFHIHETILRGNKTELGENIYLQNVSYFHNQDLSKPRNYKKILKEMIQNEPNCLHYLVNGFDEEKQAKEPDIEYKEWLRKQIIYNVMNNKEDLHYHDYAYLVFASQDAQRDLKTLINIFYQAEEDIEKGNYADSRAFHLTFAEILKKSNSQDLIKIEEEYLRALALKTDLGWWLERGNTIEYILLEFLLGLYYGKRDTISAAFYAQQLFLIQPNEQNKDNVNACQPLNRKYYSILGTNKDFQTILNEFELLKQVEQEEIAILTYTPISAACIQTLLRLNIHILFYVKEYYNEKI